MMTHGATAGVKNNKLDPAGVSHVSYSSEELESEETEISEVDAICESDQEDIDKNNNLSALPQEIFPRHSSVRKFDFPTANESNDGACKDMTSPECDDYPLYHNPSDIMGCSSAKTRFGDDEKEEDELLQSVQSWSEDILPAARNDQTSARRSETFDLRSRHANANENNNSNRKRLRQARSGSFDSQNNNNAWGFRQKMRSVQLSSVRCSKGRYQGSEIKPYKGRMIAKDGSSNVSLKKFGKLDWWSRYSKDIYTTLIDLSWTWIIFLTSLVYIGHWIIFGSIYWIFAIANDDYSKIFGSDASVVSETINSSLSGATTLPPVVDPHSEEPCVSGVYDFATAFLFSMESETTIGYGYRNMGTQCKGAIACLIFQCVLSAIFDTWVIGMCYSRIARPDARCNTIMYSKNAVICTRDGKKCFIVRVANLRKSLLLGVSCRARVITIRAPHGKEESEGHEFMLEQKELSFENPNCTMLTAPVEYVHVIDKKSPLYTIPERCLASEKQNWFEIVIIFTGMVEATGMTAHAQTSYLSTEIKYKHRFEQVISVSPKKERYVVDFRKFHETVPEPEHIARITSSRRSGSRTTGRRFEPLIEESEETDDVFESGSQELSEGCEFCGQSVMKSRSANKLCVCYRSNGIPDCVKKEVVV